MSDPVTAEQLFNVPYATVLADLQKLASTISGGDLSHSHGLDCTTVIAHHWDKQARRIAALEKGIEQAKQCYMDLAREHADYKRAHEPRGVLTDTEFSVIFMRTGIPQKIIAGLDVTPGDWFEFALAVQAFDRRTPTKLEARESNHE